MPLPPAPGTENKSQLDRALGTSTGAQLEETAGAFSEMMTGAPSEAAKTDAPKDTEAAAASDKVEKPKKPKKPSKQKPAQAKKTSGQAPRVKPPTADQLDAQAENEKVARDTVPPVVRTQAPTPKEIEKARLEVQILLGQNETLEDVAIALKRALGCKVKKANIVRAMINILDHAMEEVKHHAKNADESTRPSNHNADDMGDFDIELSRLLMAAFRDASAIK